MGNRTNYEKIMYKHLQEVMIELEKRRKNFSKRNESIKKNKKLKLPTPPTSIKH